MQCSLVMSGWWLLRGGGSGNTIVVEVEVEIVVVEVEVEVDVEEVVVVVLTRIISCYVITTSTKTAVRWKLAEKFASAEDAFAALDDDGGGELSRVELARGLRAVSFICAGVMQRWRLRIFP